MTSSLHLPQLHGGLFLTDSGLETTLIFHDGIELPHFASCTLLLNSEGQKRVIGYYERHLDLARNTGAGFCHGDADMAGKPRTRAQARSLSTKTSTP